MLVLSRKKAIQDAYAAGRQAGIDYACEEFKWSIVSPDPIRGFAAVELRDIEQKLGSLLSSLEREISRVRRRAFELEERARGRT